MKQQVVRRAGPPRAQAENVPKPRGVISDVTGEDELLKLRKMYLEDISSSTFNALIVGPKGIGKTTLATTCRKPVLIHSFDPGGTRHLRSWIERGEIIADNRFEKDDARNPTAWRQWEKEFDSLRSKGVFERIGTYFIDSLSMMQTALYSEIAAHTRFSSDGVLEIKGWAVLVNTIRDMILLCTSLPCDFVLTGHVTREKDEVSGKILFGLAAPPSLQIPVPALFDEYYVMMVSPSNNTERVLYTANTDRVQAATRIGAGKFDPIEKPDIKHLLRKAGWSTEDRQPLQSRQIKHPL